VIGSSKLITCLGGAVENKFEQFIKERQYLTNVTPATVEWYRQSLAWLGIESPSEADLKSFVMRMREKGLKPSVVIAAFAPSMPT
jgi:integrase/recombinase XerD